MAISFTNVAGVGNPTPGVSITINVPIGVGNGDFMFAGVTYIASGAGVSITPPSGWTEIQHTNSGNSSGALQCYSYYRIANGEPSNYTWALGGTGVQNGGFIAGFTGADAVSAIDASSLKEGTGTTFSSSAVSTSTNGNWVLWLDGISSNTMSFYSTPTGYTGRWTLNGAGQANSSFSTQVRATAGAVPTSSWVSDAAASDPWSVQLLALKVSTPSAAPIIATASTLTNRQRALRARRGMKVFCGWLSIDGPVAALVPATQLPWLALPVKPKRRPRQGWQREPQRADTAAPSPPPSAVASQSIGPRISLPPPTLVDDAQWQRQSAAWMKEANQGHLQNTGIVTLNASQSSTVVVDDRAGANTFIGFMPRTANAAVELRNGTLFVSSQGKQTFTITHAFNAQTDRTYIYSLLG